MRAGPRDRSRLPYRPRCGSVRFGWDAALPTSTGRLVQPGQPCYGSASFARLHEWQRVIASMPLRTLQHVMVVVFEPNAGEAVPVEGLAIDLPAPDEIRERMVAMFGDPVRTRVQPTGVGIEARLRGPSGVIRRRAVLGPGRIEAQCESPADVAQAISTLYEILMSSSPPIRPAMCGLNFVFEASVPAIRNAGQWIAERFVRHGLPQNSEWTLTELAEVKFTVRGREGLRRQVTLQPRAGRPEAFWVQVDNHFDALGFDASDPAEAEQQLIQEAEHSTAYVETLLAAPPPSSATTG